MIWDIVLALCIFEVIKRVARIGQEALATGLEKAAQYCDRINAQRELSKNSVQ
jgi:hypothetical protein